MTDALRTYILEQAKKAVWTKTARIDAINQKFTVFHGYTYNTGRIKAKAIILGIITAGLAILSPMLTSEVISILGQDMETQGLFCLIALYTMCLYSLLSMIKVIVKLNQISKINGYKNELSTIRTKLTDMLDNMDSTFDSISKQIKSGNCQLHIDSNIDSQILWYQKLADKCHDADRNSLNQIIRFFYWTSSIAFGAAVLTTTAMPISDAFCDVFRIGTTEIIIMICVILSLAVYIWINYAFIKKGKGYNTGAYLLSVASAPAGMLAMWTISAAITVFVAILVVIFVIAFISAIANS